MNLNKVPTQEEIDFTNEIARLFKMCIYSFESPDCFFEEIEYWSQNNESLFNPEIFILQFQFEPEIVKTFGHQIAHNFQGCYFSVMHSNINKLRKKI